MGVMNLVRRWLTLGLVALWPVLTSHCQLEAIASLGFLVCCEHDDAIPHQDSDCDTDGCAVIEGGFYKIEEDDVMVASPEEALGMVPKRLPTAPTATESVCFSANTAVPPELPSSWQFSFRAALPPRAPTPA